MTSMGISGEAGELTDYMKKILYHGHVPEDELIKKEIGDVLWYLAAMASVLGMSLHDIAEMNIEKLKKRYPNGFSEEDSVNREE
jgi:NTP pyrophosphatase (non-canonical NTP hydrolase)